LIHQKDQSIDPNFIHQFEKDAILTFPILIVRTFEYEDQSGAWMIRQ